MKKKKLLIGTLVGILLLGGLVAGGLVGHLGKKLNSLEDENATLKAVVTYYLNQTTTLEEDIVALEQELESLQAKYPPRAFESISELETWLLAQPNYPASVDALLWYKRGRELQLNAARDGFMISVTCIDVRESGLYNVWCTAVLEDGSIYWWDPETDNLYYFFDASHF